MTAVGAKATKPYVRFPARATKRSMAEIARFSDRQVCDLDGSQVYELQPRPAVQETHSAAWTVSIRSLESCFSTGQSIFETR